MAIVNVRPGFKWRVVSRGVTPTELAAALAGISITGANIVDGAIDNSELADNAVTGSKIAAGSITAAHIQAGAVQAAELDSNAVTETKIAALAVTNGKIADGAITATKLGALAVGSAALAANAVTTAKITDLNVTTAKLADAAITNAKLGLNAVQAGNIQAGAVVTAALAAGAVTGVKVAAATIETGNIAVGAITDTRLGTNAVTTIKILDLNVTTAKIADAAITNAKLGLNAVQAGNIQALAVGTAALAAGAVTGPKIAALTIASGNIADGAITNAKIGVNAVQAGNIQAGAVGNTALATGAVTGTKVAALTIEGGNIAAGAITDTKIGTGAVTEAKIGALAVTTAKIADASITNAKLGLNSVLAGNIQAGAVNTAALAAGAVTGVKIAASTVEGGNIAANAITEPKLNTDISQTGLYNNLWHQLFGRPGDSPRLFTDDYETGGSPWLAPILSAGTVVASAASYGQTYRLTGPGIVAQRYYTAVEPELLYEARWAYRRHVDTPDPEGDGAYLGIAFYDATKAFMTVAYAYVVPGEFLTVAAGLQDFTATLSTDPGQTVEIPNGAAYFRAFIQIFGDPASQTDIIALRTMLSSLNNAFTGGPLVANAIASIDGPIEGFADELKGFTYLNDLTSPPEWFIHGNLPGEWTGPLIFTGPPGQDGVDGVTTVTNLAFETLAALEAETDYPPFTGAIVYGDSPESNNGTYQFDGVSVWTKIAEATTTTPATNAEMIEGLRTDRVGTPANTRAALDDRLFGLDQAFDFPEGDPESIAEWPGVTFGDAIITETSQFVGGWGSDGSARFWNLWGHKVSFGGGSAVEEAFSNYHFSILDEAGNVIWGLGTDGVVYSHGFDLTFGGTGNRIEEADSNYLFAFTDEDNNVIWGITSDGIVHQKSTEEEAIDDISAKDARTMAQAQNMRFEIVTSTIGMVEGYNVAMNSPSQSNGVPAESWPVVLDQDISGWFMLGDDVRPTNLTAEGWDTLGADVLTPLRAKVRKLLVGDGVADPLTTAEAQALPVGAGNPGQSPEISAAYLSRIMLNQHLMRDTSDTYKGIVLNTGYGGTLIRQLMKPPKNTFDATDRYRRVTEAVTAAKTIVDASASPNPQFVVNIMTGIQGESNQLANTTYADYHNDYGEQLDDYNADIAAITGQSLPPDHYALITGGSYYSLPTSLVNIHGAAVANAMLDLSHERNDLCIVGPLYPYWDKINHHTANAHHAIGAKMAEVWHWRTHLRRRWRPVEPLWVERSGPRQFDVGFATDSPLQFAEVAYAGVMYMLESKGFWVAMPDDLTLYGFEISIPGQSVVRLTTSSTPGSGVLVGYCRGSLTPDVGGATRGNGNLCNSKTLDSLLTHEFLPGMYSYDFPALDGTPIDMRDWACPFAYPEGWER
jgi:hypothetical protein